MSLAFICPCGCTTSSTPGIASPKNEPPVFSRQWKQPPATPDVRTPSPKQRETPLSPPHEPRAEKPPSTLSHTSTPPPLTSPATPPPALPPPASPATHFQQEHATLEKVDAEAERRLLLQRDLAFSETSAAKGAAEAFYEFMAPDATLLQPGELPIKGTDIIKVRMAAGQQGLLTWRPEEVEVSASGDLGYTWGSYELRPKAQDRRVSYGKYANVWKKQNGVWKVVLSTVNSSPVPGVRRIERGTP